MSDEFDALIEAMIRGEAPTRRTFRCPLCGGRGGVAATPRGTRLSVSAWCRDCGEAVEMDGVYPWPGWEAASGTEQPPKRLDR